MIKLMDVIDALESVNMDTTFVYNKKECRIICLCDGMFNAEENEELLEEIEFSDDYISLPDQYDIHEYKMMADFVDTIKDERFQNQLYAALHGKGVFRRFKDTVYRFGIEKDWFKYRDEQYRRIAIEWCEKHNIEYQE